MAFRYADRVKETTTTTSTGTYDLAGAVTGFRTFVAGIGTGNVCNYVVENGTDWEVGIGTVTDATPDTLARTLVLASSNAGSAVSWAAGTKNVFCGSTAADRNPRTAKLTSDHAISSVTATEVTGLRYANLLPGTYVYQYYLIVQSATATVSPMYGVNFTGTATGKTRMQFSDQSATLLAAIGTASAVGTTALGFGMSQSVTAFSTTTPNMGHVAGVGTINTNILIVIDGILIVTVTGDLAFWHGSETATSTTIMTGSSSILTRIDD